MHTASRLALLKDGLMKTKLFAMAASVSINIASADGLSIQSAQQASGVLQVEVSTQLQAEVFEALEASVPISFIWLVDSDGKEQSFPMTMRYTPLFERFELERFGNRAHFRLRAELIDAFSNLMLPIETPVKRVRLQIQLGKLPAPLRLPAVFSSAWDLDTDWYAVKQLRNNLP
jgi:hypothetical protein